MLRFVVVSVNFTTVMAVCEVQVYETGKNDIYTMNKLILMGSG